MIVAKEGVVMINGIEPVIMAEIENILSSWYKKFAERNGEERANEMFAELGRNAIDCVEHWDERALDMPSGGNPSGTTN